MKTRWALPSLLLGASLLLNVVLLSRRPEPPAPAPRPSPPKGIKEADSFIPPEPARVAALETRVRELEAEKSVRPEPVLPPDRSVAFRQKLARVMKLWRDPRAMASAPPEAHLEAQEVSMEFQRAKLERWTNPKAYAEMIRAVLEQTAIDLKTPLSEVQRDALRRTLEDYEASLATMADADPWQRYLHEVGPEADVLQRLRSYVTPEQEAKVMGFGTMSPWTASTAPWVDRGQAEAFVTQTWSSTYGLDDTQKAAVQAAARIYVNAMDALNAQMGSAAMPGRETPEWRRSCAQILVDVLGGLESSLTPEQRARLRERRPAEVRVYDPAALQPGRR